jgi:diguanylate cyclase (GGDEF)-like protein/PAS domain S-box-containing protein
MPLWAGGPGTNFARAPVRGGKGLLTRVPGATTRAGDPPWIGADIEPGRFFEGDQVGWRILPFVLAGALPFALIPVAGVSLLDPRVVISAAIVPVIIALALVIRWERLPAWPQAILPLSYYVVVALLRDASGGSPSVFDPLVLIPLTWFALYGTRTELAVSILGLAATLIVPTLVVGGAGYGSDQLQRALVSTLLAATIAPTIQAVVISMRRLTLEARESEEALREAQERFRRAFEDSRVGMGLVSPEGRYQKVNRALCDITGYTADELMGMRFAEITHPDDVDADLGALREIVAGERYGYRTEKRYIHANGHTIWISLNVSPVHDHDGNVSYLIGQVEDVSERKENEARLTRQALHDSLTGLPNRMLFADRVRMASARRDSGGFAVVYMDLDAFKLVNDTLGHAAGDQVLVEVSKRLSKLLRTEDTLARLGGDEFAILCEGLGEEDARRVADRVIDAMAKPIDVLGRPIQQAASVGVAVYPQDGDKREPEALLGDADLAMYRAKAAGKSRYAMFESWMRAGAHDSSHLERELRDGLERGEIVVHYQPEVEISTGTITGAEALVRWQHPERGLLEPAQFLFVAESSELIVEIDDLVLREACRQAAHWHEALPDERLTVSVNISERRLSDPELSGKIAQGIYDSGLPPSSLYIEIAERAMMDRRAVALSAIPDLEALGIRLLIDDFGVAISSFGSLKRLPRLNAIKIDASFTAGLGRSREDAAGIAAIVGLAHGLGLTAMAEGIERVEQLRELQALHCDRGQGYYFARPQPAPALMELLSSARLGEMIA